jgi:hypothetical protein
MKRLALLSPLLLLLACEPVVRKVVTLAFDATGNEVTLSATTYIGDAKAGSPEYAEAEERRSALLAERDEWSLRFAQANPEAERVTLSRKRGKLESVQRTATIATGDLQKFFFDTPVTVTTTRTDGSMELNIYAGTSMRATPQQRRAAEKLINAYSRRAARYFAAVRNMYLYLEEKPLRSTAMFASVFDELAPDHLADDERVMTAAVRDAIESLLSDDDEGSAAIDRVFDLVYNPFPAQMQVVVKGETLINEGFQRLESGAYEIRMPTAFEAIGALEGKWVSPDPLALAADPANEKKSSAELAQMIDKLPRRSAAVVSQQELTDALIATMRPAARYRLRWRVGG